MYDFAMAHPIITLLITLAVLSTITTIIRGRPFVEIRD